MTPAVSIVVPTRDRPRLLGELLASLERAERSTLSWELVVVDSATRPDLQGALRAALDRTSLPVRRLAETRPGKSRALNRALGAVRGEFVAFLDDDVRVHPDYLTGLERTLSEWASGVFGGRVLPAWPYPPPAWITGGAPLAHSRGSIIAHDYGDRPRPYDRTMRLPVGCNLVCRRALFARHGGFDERIGPGSPSGGHGGEETELLRRLRAGGEEIVYSPWIAIDHPVDPRRMTRREFAIRHFKAGRTKRHTARGRYPAWLGVPRYLFGQVARALAGSAAAAVRGDGAACFEHQLVACEAAGAIYEYLRVRDGAPAAAAPGEGAGR